MVTCRGDSGIMKDTRSPPSSQSSSHLPGASLALRCHPKGHFIIPSLLSHATARLPRKSKDLMLL